MMREMDFEILRFKKNEVLVVHTPVRGNKKQAKKQMKKALKTFRKVLPKKVGLLCVPASP